MKRIKGFAMGFAAVMMMLAIVGCSGEGIPVKGKVLAGEYTVHFQTVLSTQEEEVVGESIINLLSANMTISNDQRYLFVVINKVEKGGREMDTVPTMKELKAADFDFKLNGKSYTSSITVSNENTGFYAYLLVVPKEVKDSGVVQLEYNG